MRCPRCSAQIAEDQDWCLECGAPARTRLAPTPNWHVPTLGIAVIVLIAGALLAFAFVKLTGDDGATPAPTAPVATQPAAPPAVVPTTPAPPSTTGTAPAPSQTQATAPPTNVPGQTTPTGATTTPPIITPAPRKEREP